MDEPGETSTDKKYEFKYDARGIASVIKDNVLMTETRVTSDLADRPSESVTRDANGNLLHKSVLNYDGKNRVKEFVDILTEVTHKTEYTYDADNRVTEVKYDNSDTHKVNYSYDLLNRITTKCVTNGVPYTTTYGFVDGDTATYGANATTPLISTITQGSGANAMNFAYTYDSRGNILRKDAYSHTTGSVSGNGSLYWNYGYDTEWKDQLKTVTKYNQSNVELIDNSNAVFTYDAIGNPLSDGTWTYVWEKGRQLKSMHNASTGVTMEFKYNHNGIRTQKVKKVNGTVTETTDYILKGKQIAAMKKNTDTYYFTYDASGAPATVNFNGVNYAYVKNLQGDIVGILDASGSLVVEYRYDAWGAPTSILCVNIACDDLAFDNPFRYRGYVWDEETELYYLWSRYYRPELGRFVNIDIVFSKNIIQSIYSYAENDSITKEDSTGCIANRVDGLFTYNVSDRVGDIYDKAIEINELLGRMVVSYEEIDKAINYPIPNDIMKDIGRNNRAHGETTIFSYAESVNSFTVYNRTRKGSIIKKNFSYKRYSLKKDESFPLVSIMEYVSDAYKDPSFSLPFLSSEENFILSLGMYLYGEATKQPLPPTLHENSRSYIYETEADREIRSLP